MFDLQRFIAAVSQNLLSSGSSEPPRLKIIVEALGAQDRTELPQRLREALQVDLKLEPLFPGAEESALIGAERLANYYRLTIPGIDFELLDQNPFDLCYYLIDRARLRSADPCLPPSDTALSLNTEDMGPWSSGSSGGKDDCKKGPTDRGWPLRNMRVDKAWQLTPPGSGKKYGEGIVICQPDTGYCDHVDLQPPALAKDLGWNFIEGGNDPRDHFIWGLGYNPGHGGSVAAVIIGRGTLTSPPPSGTGTTGPGIIVGVAPKCRLMPVRAVTGVVLWSGEHLAEGIWWALRNYGPGEHLVVISISLGGYPGSILKSVEEAIDVAIWNYVIVVCAAGNHFPSVVYPACTGKPVVVAGSNIDDKPWSGSSYGKAVVDVAAPAECIWTTWRAKDSDPHDAVGSGSGTSYATAEVAGILALWFAFHFEWFKDFYQGTTHSWCELAKAALRKTARKPAGWDPEYGAGIVDAHALLQKHPLEILDDLAAAEAKPAVDPVYAGLLSLAGVAPGSPQDQELRSHLAEAFGVVPAEVETMLARYGRELTYLLVGAGGLRPEGDLLTVVREKGSSALRAALSVASPVS